MFYKHFKSLESTNLWLGNNLDLICKNKIVCITTDEQTNGRGRKNRYWHSYTGNIFLSYGYVLNNFENIRIKPLSLSLAIINSLTIYGINNVKIKWPNDILLNNKKIGGLLIEKKRFKNDEVCILGVGLNININPLDLESISRRLWPAGSIYTETNINISKKDLIKTIISNIKKYIEINEFSEILNEYIKYSALIYQKIVIDTDIYGKLIGICKGFNHNGELILDIDNKIINLYEGDILSISYNLDTDNLDTDNLDTDNLDTDNLDTDLSN